MDYGTSIWLKLDPMVGRVDALHLSVRLSMLSMLSLLIRRICTKYHDTVLQMSVAASEASSY